ncbi:response regulator [Neolewinella aurantiaca]|uniref:histidine kinase n=2 Tax=Neolewinella aurantiaca TaxID=2602767 RepID=A0A5C7FNU7_9BACT|nr:response regulator [Neolewinella aurantiaca]
MKGYYHNPFDSVSLANNTIHFIVEDDQQNLWIASDSYLSFFDRRKEVFQNFFKGQRTSYLYAGKKGSIWAMVNGKGLLKVSRDESSGQITFDSVKTAASGGNTLIGDEFGRVWIGAQDGLTQVENGTANKPATGFGFPVNQLEKGKDQGFWVASGATLRRVMYFKEENRLEVTAVCELPPLHERPEQLNRIVSLRNGKDNQLWIGTEDGLYRLNTLEANPVPVRVEDPTQFTRSALQGKINAITTDKYNNVWVGSTHGVVKILARASMLSYTDLRQLSASMSDNRVKAVFEDGKGDTWIGTEESGLYHQPAGSNAVNRIPLAAQSVANIAQRRFGEGLFVAGGNHLYEVDTSLDRPVASIKYSLSKAVMAEVEVSETEQWVGTWGDGLKIFNDDRELPIWKQELVEQTKHDFISLMVVGRNKYVWIGTRGNGLYRVSLQEGKVWHYLPSREKGVTSNAFISVVNDSNGNIWFGTRGGGVLLYNESTDTFTPYTTGEGLPSNTISAMLIDLENNLWLSTPEGIAVFRPHEQTFYTLTTDDGIYENNFQYNSAGSSPDRQRLYFGTTGGYYTIRGGDFKPRQLQAPTVITNLRTYGANALAHDTSFVAAELFSTPRQISLPYYRNNLSIGFSSLDLTAPNKTRYAYRLTGINDYWIYPDNDAREAIYFDLPHGKYHFAVKSTNSDGVWNEEAASLELTILPPYYLTVWAYWGYGIIAVFIAYLLYRLYRQWYQLRKNLLEEKISREKSQEYHQMRLVFFTDISHELRTPLTLILGTIENWKKRGGENLPVTSIQRVYANSIKMKQLINQLLDVHKHNAGEFELKVRPVNAARHFRQVVSTFTDHAAMNQLNLGFSSDGANLQAFLDLSITDKIIGNLVSNAIKYTTSGGTINVSLSQQTLKKKEAASLEITPGEYLSVVVEDNGIGMDEQDLLHVFDRYYQAKNQTPAHQSGSGIGMELVYKLTRLHQGAIIAESELGLFTRFIVYLPVEAELYPEATVLKTSPEPASAPENLIAPPVEHPAYTPRTEQPSGGKKGSVLVVEDNEELRQTIVDILSDDFNVLEAANGREGFEQAKQHTPRVIITDLVMPVGDGLSLIKNVRSDEATRHLPVFVLTAKSSDEARKECLEAGASDFIEKPFSMEFLRWKIHNSMDQQKSMRDKFSKTISVQSSEIELESPDEYLIQDLIKLVEDNIENPELSVQFLAHEIGMSRANLYRKLKSIVNDTPVSFIKKIRLDRARKILKMNKFYVSEVAYMCGFSSRKYFTRCFQKAFGCSPSEYAEQHKSSLSETEPTT